MNADHKTKAKAILLAVAGAVVLVACWAYGLAHTHEAAGADYTKSIAGLSMLAGSAAVLIGLVNLPGRQR